MLPQTKFLKNGCLNNITKNGCFFFIKKIFGCSNQALSLCGCAVLRGLYIFPLCKIIFCEEECTRCDLL